MAPIAPVIKNLRPLPGAQVRQYQCGETLKIGDWVLLNPAGKVVKHGGTTSKTIGLIVSTSNKTDTALTGEFVGVCWFGPVAGFATLVPGRLTYLGAAGGIADTGTVPVAYNESADIMVVMIGVSNAAS